jgi:hypothetical protein
MNKEILYLSPTYKGSVHDKSICNSEELEFYKELAVFVDLGFLGISSDKAKIIIPFKHKKNHELSDVQKVFNKGIKN